MLSRKVQGVTKTSKGRCSGSTRAASAAGLAFLAASYPRIDTEIAIESTEHSRDEQTLKHHIDRIDLDVHNEVDIFM